MHSQQLDTRLVEGWTPAFAEQQRSQRQKRKGYRMHGDSFSLGGVVALR